jgi:hypothetical protein
MVVGRNPVGMQFYCPECHDIGLVKDDGTCDECGEPILDVRDIWEAIGELREAVSELTQNPQNPKNRRSW